MKGRNFGRIAMTGLGLVLVSTPAFAQEGGTLNLIDMFHAIDRFLAAHLGGRSQE